LDTREKAADVDDGSDDWYEFGDETNRRVIGRALVNRAKRAFWDGKSWDDFAEDERDTYSEAIAIKKSPIVLSNEIRMEVFYALKQRLCEEIWLETYRDPPGLVKLSLWTTGGHTDSVQIFSDT
jgi:hypothetical protein